MHGSARPAGELGITTSQDPQTGRHFPESWSAGLSVTGDRTGVVPTRASVGLRLLAARREREPASGGASWWAIARPRGVRTAGRVPRLTPTRLAEVGVRPIADGRQRSRWLRRRCA